VITNTFAAILQHCTRRRFICHTQTPKHQDSFTEHADMDYGTVTPRFLWYQLPYTKFSKLHRRLQTSRVYRVYPLALPQAESGL